MTIMSVVQGVIILKALNTYGTTSDVFFYGIAFRVMSLFMTPILGLMRALQPVVGINFGARQYRRVIGFYKVFTATACILVLPLWLFFMVFPNGVLHLMMPDALFSLRHHHYFRLTISVTPLLCVVLTAMTFWPAIKKPKPAMIFGIGRQLFLYIPLMIVLPKFFGIASIYVGSFLIDLVLAIIILVMITREFNTLRNFQAAQK